MISEQNLKIIAFNKFEDAKILFNANRYDSSLYLVGYSIEIALKSKICYVLKLDKGFPENKEEFNDYVKSSDNELGGVIKQLSDIRTHNLGKLLFYSGQEYVVKEELFAEWIEILYWNPELRYNLKIGDRNYNEKK